jgi:MFS family permease
MSSDVETRARAGGTGDSAADERQMSLRRLLGVLVLAVIGFAFQQTSIVPAVQTVQQSLGGSSEWSAWLVTVYLIVATVATPAMGRLGDLYGRRRLLLIGLSIFVLGSIAAAFAPSMPVLIVCRAVQGVGGSVYPLSLAIARAVLPAEKVSASVAVLTGAFGVGTAIGFVSGGLLAEYASWRWIFGAGAVLVAAGTVLVWRTLPSTPERATGGFDRAGTGVLTLSVIGLLTALTLVVPLGWTSPATIVLFLITVGSFAGWLALETRRDDPLIDLHVLREPAVAVANLATMGLGWALFSSFLLVPELAETSPQHGFGLAASVTGVGLIMLPLAVGQTVLATTGGWLAGRVGARWVFAGGLVVVAAALAALCAVHRSAIATALLLLMLGAGSGAALETASEVATEGVSGDVAAVSSALNSTLRRLAGGIGGQASTILLASLVVAGGSQPSHTAYVVSFLLAAGMSLAGAVLVAARRTSGS